MEYLCTVLLSIGCLAGADAIEKKKIQLGHLVILSIVRFFICYVISSGILFWSNFFSVQKATLLTLVISCVALVYGVKKNGIHGITVQCNLSSSYLPLFAIIIMALFNSGHFGFFGMGQDQGVYQTEAINLYYGIPMKGVIIDEYDELNEGEYKNYYKDWIKGKLGYDLLADNTAVPGIEINNIHSDVEGNWHGIPTFAAMLALSAKIFGVSSMQILGGILFICFLCIVEFILASQKIHQAVRMLCIVLLGLSPEIIWVKKSALTEIFLAVLIVTYLYYLMVGSEKELLKSVYPVIAFSYFHVTIFTMMPAFVINYWLLYFRTKKKDFLFCVKKIIIGYLTGFFMMWSVQPNYTLRNYKNGLFFLSFHQIVILAVLASIVVWLVTDIIKKVGWRIFVSDKVYFAIVRCLCIVGVGFIFFQAGIKQYNDYEYKMLTLVCFSVLSGVIILPAVLVKLCGNKCIFTDSKMILINMFVWCIIIYSAVMRRDVQYYYYYGRYLMPYISIIVILFTLLMKSNRYFQIAGLICGICILFPYAHVLRENNDDSRMEWHVLDEVLNNSEGAASIFIEPDIAKLLYYPIKAATGAKVYPIMNTLDDTLEYIPEKNKSQCLYITGNMTEDHNSWLKLRYRNISVYEEDNLSCRSKWLGLVTDINLEQQYTVSVYELENETNYIESKSEEAFLIGWAGANDLGFRWVNADESSIGCYLTKDDYLMEIGIGNAIPFGKISKDKIEVKVYLNDVLFHEMIFTEANTNEPQQIEIPEKLVNSGYNCILFKSDAWSPAEYGGEDRSNYGFSVDYIQFMHKGTIVVKADSKINYLDGWNAVNDQGNRWSGEYSTLKCNLFKCNYLMCLEPGDVIPFDLISQDNIRVKIYINGKYIQDIEYTRDNVLEKKQIHIPKNVLNEGSNEIVFKSNAWSPVEYGSTDPGRYGFSISCIKFIEESSERSR